MRFPSTAQTTRLLEAPVNGRGKVIFNFTSRSTGSPVFLSDVTPPAIINFERLAEHDQLGALCKASLFFQVLIKNH